MDAEFDNDPSLKEEYNRIYQDLKENPLKIDVEKSEFLYHPSDYVDSRIGVAFVGDYSFLAGLFTEFWSGNSIKPYVFTDLEEIEQTTLTANAINFEKNLQKNELDQYQEKMESSPFGMNLSEEEITTKIDNIMSTGDKSRLLLNSKRLSPNEFCKIYFKLSEIEKTKIDFTQLIAKNDVDNRIKAIFFVSGKESETSKIITPPHPTIPTVTPELPQLGNRSEWSKEQFEEFLTFIQNLPDVLQFLV